MKELSQVCAEDDTKASRSVAEIDVENISSPVLARLIEEVRNEKADSINAYNRMHNRHNRSR